MERRGFSRPEIAFLLGVPLAWAVLLLFHPTGEGDLYPAVRDQLTPWLTVHVGMMLFIPLIALVLFLLLRGVEGRAARVARIALPFFAVLYAAYEVTLGIGVGILMDEVNQLPAAQTATGAGLVQAYSESTLIRVLEYAGSLAWYIAVVAASIALVRHAGAPRSVAVLLLLAAVPISFHAPPFGPVGLALFVGAVLLLLRGWSADRATPARSVQPRPA